MSRLKYISSEAEKYLSLLVETTRRIQICSTDFDESQLSSPSPDGKWSAIEILSHIRGCAELWSISIYAMLAQENSILPDIHPRRWAKVRRYTDLGFTQSFAAFALERQELLGVMRALSADEWSRSADIGGRSHTIFSQIRRMALHETEHCQQIEDLLQR